MRSRKDSAVSFLNLAASGHVQEAYREHVSAANFHHHNPFFADGATALMAGMEENARQYPDKTLEVLHAIEEGDIVVVHSRVQPRQGDRGAALVHLFRFEGDRIAELWDIGQPVPADAVNGMF